jgi:thiol:disulfide interchange protein
MAQSDPEQLATELPSSPTGPAGSSGREQRWLAACLLLVVAVSAIALALRHTRSPSSIATLQEVCPASDEAEESCQLPEYASATREAFPTEAEAQVDWILRYHRPAMVLFYSQICRPCMMMEALVQMVRHDYEPAVTFIEVASDDPDNATLVRRMGVGTIPASFFIMPSGDIKRIGGPMKQLDLRAELASLVAAGQALLPSPTGPPAP